MEIAAILAIAELAGKITLKLMDSRELKGKEGAELLAAVRRLRIRSVTELLGPRPADDDESSADDTDDVVDMNGDTE